MRQDAAKRLLAAAAVGTGRGEDRVSALVEAGSILVVDTAHGHSQGVLDRVAWIKQTFPQVEVIGGNIATGEAARRWSKSGGCRKGWYRSRVYLYYTDCSRGWCSSGLCDRECGFSTHGIGIP